MLEKQWDRGEDDEELFEYAMHPAQYEAYKSGKAKEDFLADVKKRREEIANASAPVDAAENKPKVLTVDVNGQAYRVTVAYGAVDPTELAGAAPVASAPPAAPCGVRSGCRPRSGTGRLPEAPGPPRPAFPAGIPA
jgi:pyruvate carboxylase subunit B